MNFNDLISQQQSKRKEPVNVTDALYLRTLQASVAVVAKREGEREALAKHPIRRLLREAGACGGGLESENDDPHLLEQLESIVARDGQDMSLPDAWAPVAAGVGRAFSYSPAEQALFELALHVNLRRDVQRVLNVVGEVDDEEAAQLFADILCMEQDSVVAALRRPDPFRRLQGFELHHASARPFMFLRFSPAASAALRNSPSLDRLLTLFCRPSPPPRLVLADFPDQQFEIQLLRRYLGRASADGRTGVNILLHGKPGTGKTELVRALAADLGHVLVEIPSVDEDRDPLPPWKRLTALAATQDVMRSRDTSLVLFDEVEDIFPLEGGVLGGQAPSGGDRNKGWLTQLLEENARPTVWVSNHVRHIDSAYIRRFDIVLELSAPSKPAREHMIDSLFSGVPMKREALSRLKEEDSLAPAHLERLAGVLRALAPANEDEADNMFAVLERQTLKAHHLTSKPRSVFPRLPFRFECLNTDVDLTALVPALQRTPSARLCLFGPPGTGKTEWTRQLAARLRRPLHVKRASDLLGKFVGQSEQQVREAFDTAVREGAVLLIDEADSLLRNREQAHYGWEVSLVNEVLTCMETFEGIFVASTNLQASLDPASARRFDFKVRFGTLRQQQVRLLFADLLVALDGDASAEVDLPLMEGATPGDFSNVLRQARLLNEVISSQRLVELLQREIEGRGKATLKRIGFV